MTFDELIDNITQWADDKGILVSENVPQQTMKVMEELGELSDEILTSMNLQRNTKIAKFSKQNVEDEFADVLGFFVAILTHIKIREKSQGWRDDQMIFSLVLLNIVFTVVLGLLAR